ncbi:hypothetical protein SKM57_11030 [Acinetobacter faecalis]|uniref:hypothetical protein n=1 Tax=Acinetobacter faecalis TaxID=2665161 RepID=UPI002A90DA7B|nr:hypothetical protein [Acinetobacter faecalis]MDY6469112.1 hypothetical protein [Acinetobacter faecalis]
MSIEKLEEFARDGQKNTDELILTDGFPRPKFPARQWFNYLFNMLSLKINELIELDPISKAEIVDNLTTDDATKPVSAKQAKVLQDNKLDKTDLKDASTTQKGIVQLVNNLTSGGDDAGLTAEMGKYLNDQMFGVGQTWQNVKSIRFAGTTYTNDTDKTITIWIDISFSNDGSFYFNDEVFCNYRQGSLEHTIICLPIPPSGRYKMQHSPSQFWEMR